jgi:hypothetical protein
MDQFTDKKNFLIKTKQEKQRKFEIKINKIKNTKYKRKNNSLSKSLSFFKNEWDKIEIFKDNLEEILNLHQIYDHETKIQNLKNIIDFILKNLIKINTKQVIYSYKRLLNYPFIR